MFVKTLCCKKELAKRCRLLRKINLGKKGFCSLQKGEDGDIIHERRMLRWNSQKALWDKFDQKWQVTGSGRLLYRSRGEGAEGLLHDKKPRIFNKNIIIDKLNSSKFWRMIKVYIIYL